MEPPLPARPAATVIVARPGPQPDAPVEILMLRRAPATRFAPGYVVFPGGSVDPGDADLADRWFGSRREVARACGLRELAEETGLVMTVGGLVAAPGRLPGDGELVPPASRQLPEIGHWVAPDFLPVRFDARFFAAVADRSLRPSADGVEAEAAWWSNASDVLEGALHGASPLMWPTLKMLEALDGCRSVQDVLDLRVEQVEPPRTYPHPARRP